MCEGYSVARWWNLDRNVVEEFLRSINYARRSKIIPQTGKFDIGRRPEWEPATRGSRKEAPAGMNLVSACHLAYDWGSKVDAFRVRVCVRIVCCLSHVCASHSARSGWRSRPTDPGTAGRRASRRRGHPEKGAACAQGCAEEKRAEEEAGRRSRPAAGAGRARAAGRNRGPGHGRYRQRHRQHVAGARRRNSDR